MSPSPIRFAQVKYTFVRKFKQVRNSGKSDGIGGSNVQCEPKLSPRFKVHRW
jgi:hypothetical protein